MLDKYELLVRLKRDRPLQSIHEVISFEENKFGFYNVVVRMETGVDDGKINYIECVLPYPLLRYERLTKNKRKQWKESCYWEKTLQTFDVKDVWEDKPKI